MEDTTSVADKYLAAAKTIPKDAPLIQAQVLAKFKGYDLGEKAENVHAVIVLSRWK